jgi:hypothetical protein
MISLPEYIANEEANTDLFLFIKHVNPSMFKKYIAHNDNEELQSVSRVIEK